MGLKIIDDGVLSLPAFSKNLFRSAARRELRGMRSGSGWTGKRNGGHFVWTTGYPFANFDDSKPKGAEKSTSVYRGVVEYQENAGFKVEKYMAMSATDDHVDLWAFANQGTDCSYMIRLPDDGKSAEALLYSEQGGSFLTQKITDDETTIYGYADNEIYNFQISGNIPDETSFIRVYGEGSNVYGSLYTNPGDAFLSLSAEDNDRNALLGASRGMDSTLLRLFGKTTYASLFITPRESALFGYSDSGTYCYVMSATDDQVLFRVYGAKTYASLATSEKESFLYGYSGDNAYNYVLRAADDPANLNTQALFRLFDDGSKNYTELKVSESAGGHSAVLYTYADNAKISAMVGAASEASGVQRSFATLFDEGTSNYASMTVNKGSTESFVYGFADDEKFNYKLAAEGGSNAVRLELWGSDSGYFSSILSRPMEVAAWGFVEDEAHGYILRARPNIAGAQCVLFGDNSVFYADVFARPKETGMFGYSEDMANLFILRTTPGDANGPAASVLQLATRDNDYYAAIQAGAFENEASLWFYEPDGASAKIKCHGSYSQVQAFTASVTEEEEQNLASIESSRLDAGLVVITHRGDSSYLTSTTLGIRYASDDAIYLDPDGLSTSSGSNNSAAIAMFVRDLGGEDRVAMFREIERCDGKRARVLMTDWYEAPEAEDEAAT